MEARHNKSPTQKPNKKACMDDTAYVQARLS